MTDRELLELIAQKVVRIEGEITEIKTDIVQMKGEIVEIKGDIVQMNGKINDLQQKQDVIMEQTAGLTEFRASASNAIENGNDSLEFWKARQIALEEEVFRLKKKIS